MKKKSTLMAMLMACFLTFFIIHNGFAADPVKPRMPEPPAGIVPQKTTSPSFQKPEIPDAVRNLRRAKITNLEVGTTTSGIWTWTATVKNTGTTDLNGGDLTVQGMSIAFPPAQNTWEPASGSIVGQTVLTPGQSVQVTRHWGRCCRTDQLKVELRDRDSNQIWDTRTVTGLLYNTVLKKPLDVRVKRIEWNASDKSWQATVKNQTNFTVKINVQGYLWPAGTNNPLPAGGQQLILGPQAQKTTMALHAPSAVNNDLLKIHIWFPMQSTNCNESWEDCGGRGSNNITIPNSRDF